MPMTIRAFTVEDENGDYNVYLNTNLSEDAKKKSYSHEARHISNGDFASSDNASIIEKKNAI